jgi:hypothetical protein
MVLDNNVNNIETNHDLARLIRDMLNNYESNLEEWPNNNLKDYLEALSAWIDDAKGYYKNLDQELPNKIVWQTIAKILLAAKYYE